MRKLDTSDVLKSIGVAVAPEEQSVPRFRLGNIDPAYSSGRPRVEFDGEGSLSTKSYPYLESYTPAANDRVLVARVGRTWVILGKIV